MIENKSDGDQSGTRLFQLTDYGDIRCAHLFDNFISSMPNSQVNILTQNIFINSNQSQSAQRAVWASLLVSLHIRRAFDSRHEYATDDSTSKRILHHSFIAFQEKHRVVHLAHTSSLDPLCFHLPA